MLRISDLLKNKIKPQMPQIQVEYTNNKLALNMIVCNELKCLKKYFDRMHFDEVVVVDTGSTDGTVEFLQSFPYVKLIQIDPDYEIEGKKYLNYAKARNIAIDNTKSEWILSIDADEAIHSNDICKIYDLVKIKHIYDAFYIPIFNFYKNPQDKDFDIKNAKHMYPGLVPRLFKNNGIKYYGLIHERIDRSIKYKNYAIIKNWGIQHWGYVNKQKVMANNNELYRILMEEQVRLDNSSFHYYLLSKWWLDKNDIKATEYCKEAIKNLRPEYIIGNEDKLYKGYLKYLLYRPLELAVENINKL